MAVRKIKTRAGTVRWQTRTPDRRQVARNFDTQRAAKAWAAEQEAQKARAPTSTPGTGSRRSDRSARSGCVTA